MASTAEAAKNWTGKSGGSWNGSGNWSGSSGRRYFNKNNLTGDKSDIVYLSENVTETKNTGLCFYHVPDSGYWRFHGQNKYTFDNSGNTSNFDQDLICIGYDGVGSTARFYAISLKTRHLTIGGDKTYGGGNIVKKDMTGHLILDNLDDDAKNEYGPVTITATQSCDFYKGDLYATNATINCNGDMKIYNFTAEFSGGKVVVANGKWTRFEADRTGLLIVRDGCVFTTRLIHDDGADSASIVFDGGTLEANAYDSQGLIENDTINVVVKSRGATINTGSFNPILNAAFNKDPDSAGDLTVIGGGSAIFSKMGDLSGALKVGDGTSLHWFDQDGKVSQTCGFASLALGAGSTVYLNGDATGIDALPATVTTTATSDNPATININFSEVPKTGEKFNLFKNVSSENIKVEAVFAGVVIPVSATVEGDTLVVTVVAEDYTWNSTGTKWSDDGAWTKGGSSVNWSDGNAAIFNGGEVVLDKNVSASELSFIEDASVNAGETTETAPILTTPKIDVIEGKTATVLAELSSGVEKTGLGTLVLSKSRENKTTTVSEGTLKISEGVAIGTLRLGTDKSKPVTFDYDRKTLNANPTTYLGAGMDVALVNGVYRNDGTITFSNDTFPYTLTVGENSRVEASDRFNFNTSGEATINIDGGILQSDANNNNWIMQASQKGVLNINVTDGGLLEFGGETYMLTCRDGDDKYESPELHISVVDSTVRVKNGKSLRLGRDSNTKTSAKPTLSLAATNSVFDIGYGLYLGNDKEGLSTEGSYTADFQNCVITAFQFCVYSDRPVNKAVLNGTRLAFNREGASLSQQSDDEVERFVIGEEGLTIDTQAYSASLKANLGGNGDLTKVGGGKLTIEKSQTAGGVLNVLEGTVLVAADVTLNKSIKVASGATLELVSLSKDSPIATGSTFIFEKDSKLVLPAISEVGKFRLFALDNGEFSENATENITIEGIDIPHKLVVEGSTIFIELSYEGDTRKGAWTGKANDRDLLNPANWVNGELPTETAFIGVADNVKLVCNNRFDVKAIEFYGDGELEVSGNGSIVVQSISSICSTRPVINVPVEFKTDEDYAAIDVTGEVDFQGGVKGTVPVNHTTFYGTYTLTAQSWTLTEAITLAEGAEVVASSMELLTAGKILNARVGAKLEIKELRVNSKGNVFGDFAGELILNSFYVYNPGGAVNFNSGFSGMLRTKGIVNHTGGRKYDINFTPAPNARIVIGSNVESRIGWLKLGSFVARSYGDWKIQLTKNNYTYAEYSQDIEINSGSFDVDTSNYDDPTALKGYTVTVENNETKYPAQTVNQLLKGAGAMSAFGNGTLQFNTQGNFTGGFTASNGVTLVVKKNVYPGKGNVTIKDTATLKLIDSASGTVPVAGKLTMEGGSTLHIPQFSASVVPISVNSFELANCENDKKVTIKIDGGSLISGYNVILESDNAIPENAWSMIDVDISADGVSIPEGMEESYVTHGNALCILVKGANDCIWTGSGETAKFSDLANWRDGKIPSNGANLYIPASSDITIINDIENFSPASITFSAGSGSVTIDGEKAIKVTAITNLSSSVQNIACRIDFVDTYRVHCATQPINFSGGAYATYPDASITSDTMASHTLMGEIHFTEDWTIPDQPANKPFAVAPNARVYGKTVTAQSYQNTNYHLRIDTGAIAEFETVAVAGKLVFRLNGGDLRAKGDVTLGGENKRDFGYYNAENNGTVEAHGIYKNVTGDGLIYQYITSMVVGEGGYGMYRKDYSIQFCKDLRLTAKADFSIHKPIAEDGPKNGDWGLFLNGKTFTIDTAGHKVIFDSYVGNGKNATSGAIVKEGEGELVMASLEKRYSGATTVNGGTLKVVQPVKGLGTGGVTVNDGGTLALVPGVTLSNSSVSVENGGAFACVESGTVVLGSDLNLADGAKLKFTFSKRNIVPVLDVAEKTVTLGENKALTVAIDGVKRPCAGRHVLTSGGQFAEAVVSLDGNHPKWVLGVGVNDDGNIYADIKPIATRIIVR